MMRLNIGFLPALIPPGRFVLQASCSQHYPPWFPVSRMVI
jgi:hypothetical protein